VVTAEITYVGAIDDTVQVKTSTGHELQYGGYGGDGFCYTHQSFSCIDKLSDEERQAISDAFDTIGDGDEEAHRSTDANSS